MRRTPAEIPNRAVYKPSEVCEIAQLQPFILRSWETEFPDLGVAKGSGGGRVYRRADLERVLRIKHLLFVEGLTLAGVRRRFEEEQQQAGAAGTETSPGADEDLISIEVRARLDTVKRGLRSILEMLARNGAREQARDDRMAASFELTAGETAPPAVPGEDPAPVATVTPMGETEVPAAVPARRRRPGSRSRKR
jgi:DNA-binding transcriptional MerR regulator